MRLALAFADTAPIGFLLANAGQLYRSRHFGSHDEAINFLLVEVSIVAALCAPYAIGAIAILAQGRRMYWTSLAANLLMALGCVAFFAFAAASFVYWQSILQALILFLPAAANVVVCARGIRARIR